MEDKQPQDSGNSLFDANNALLDSEESQDINHIDKEKPDFAAYKDSTESTEQKPIAEEVKPLKHVLQTVYGGDINMDPAFSTVLRNITNPESMNIRELDKALNELSPALGIQKKLFHIASMSIMEWCSTYGCEKETKLKCKEWLYELDELKKREEAGKKLFSSISSRVYPDIKTLFDEVNAKIPLGTEVFKNVYKTSFLYALKRTQAFLELSKELPEEKKYEPILSEIAEFPKEAKQLILGAVISQELIKGKDIAPLLNAIKQSHYPYALRLPKGKSFSSKTFEVQTTDLIATIKHNIDSAEISLSHRQEVDSESHLNMYLEADVDAKAKYIDGSIKSLLVEMPPSAKLFINGEELKQEDIELHIKTPVDINVIYKNNKISFKVKEPLILHLTVKIKMLTKPK